MDYRSAPVRAVLVSIAVAAGLGLCSASVLLTAACGIRVSAQNFPVLKLSSTADAEAPKK
jgi:hypothetical protein